MESPTMDELLEMEQPLKCYRTACDNRLNVTCQHSETGRFYCPACARKINDAVGYAIVVIR